MRLGSGIGVTARRTVPLLIANLAVIGDSIARGTPTGNVSAFTYLNLPGANINLTYAVSGLSIHNSGGEIDSGGGYAQFYFPGKTNAVLWQRGTNDFGVVGFNDSQVYSELSTEIARAKAAGLYTIVCTILPRADTNWNSTKEGYRLAYNARVLANAAGADFIIDLTANAQMGAVGNASDTSKYGDGLHPTLLGQTYLLNPTYNDRIRTALTKPALVYTATLATLTLATATATVGAAYSSTIAGRTNGSTITASSSDGTSLTVSGSTVSGTFTAAGTPTITLVETLAGATGSPKTSTPTVTVSSGVNYVRMTTLTRFSEAAHSGGGYDYTPTSTSYGDGGAAVSTVAIPAGADGYVGAKNTNPTGDGPLIGGSTNAGTVNFNGLTYALFGSVGSNYQVWLGGTIPTANGNASFPVLAGDTVQFRRSGTNGILEVARSGSSTYAVVHTVAGVSSGPIYAAIGGGNPGAGNVIVTPFGSSNVA